MFVRLSYVETLDQKTKISLVKIISAVYSISFDSFEKETPFNLHLNFIYNSKLKQMGQSFNSVIGQLTSMSRGSTTLVTSPTTPLSPHSEQLIQSK